MPKRTIKVFLTNEDRERLEKIVQSNKSSQHDKLKAQVLLLTDVSDKGLKNSSKDTVIKLGISPRSVSRIREAYAQNSSIEDVFRFVGLSEKKNIFARESFVDLQNPKLSKKKNTKYVEIDDTENEYFLIENIKCRVTLTKEEREQLESIIKDGKQSIRKFNRAKILLLADEGVFGPAMSDKDIADKLDVSKTTVARVRRLLINQGQVENVLNFNHNKAGRPPKIDGKVQAMLVAQACSTPPEGRCKWTVRLLADQLVALEVVDSISHTAVADALKKMNLNLGSVRNG